jgi:hypothetical protein
MKNTIRISILLSLLAPVGCLPSSPTANNAESSTPGVTAEEATPRKTIHETTQNVLDLEQALSDGAILASTEIEAKDPLMISAEAYRTSVGKISGMAVYKAIQIRDAQSIRDPQPLTHETLMAEIIKKGKSDGIHLPMLPYYQEYAWDQANQKLVVVDFPARKAERLKQR